MNLRFNMMLAVLLAFIPLAMPAAAAEQPQAVEAVPALVQNQSEALQSCPKPGDNKLNMAQTSPADCCKGHKGVCGCRAGKIICCDQNQQPVHPPHPISLRSVPTPLWAPRILACHPSLPNRRPS